ncbi:hypothetical protein QFZ91_000739 [Paraburkholderia sp. JPY419]
MTTTAIFRKEGLRTRISSIMRRRSGVMVDSALNGQDSKLHCVSSQTAPDGTFEIGPRRHKIAEHFTCVKSKADGPGTIDAITYRWLGTHRLTARTRERLKPGSQAY